jgi:hypothetical protein
MSGNLASRAVSAIERDAARERQEASCTTPPASVPVKGWNAAVAHSLENPTHILGPYHDAYGVLHMSCEGDGDPYEPPNCDFTTAAADTPDTP